MPMKTRRQVIIALGASALALPLKAFAQQAQKSYRIGFLASEAPSDPSQAKRLELLKSGLRDLGYVEGKNIVIEVRWAEGQYDRLPALASELIALKVGVIVASGTKATMAAKNATATVPIVMGRPAIPSASALLAVSRGRAKTSPDGPLSGAQSWERSCSNCSRRRYHASRRSRTW